MESQLVIKHTFMMGAVLFMLDDPNKRWTID